MKMLIISKLYKHDSSVGDRYERAIRNVITEKATTLRDNDIFLVLEEKAERIWKGVYTYRILIGEMTYELDYEPQSFPRWIEIKEE